MDYIQECPRSLVYNRWKMWLTQLVWIYGNVN